MMDSIIYLLAILTSFLTAVHSVLDTNYLPQNVAVYSDQEIILSCRGADVAGPTPRIQWTEFAYNSNGNMVSDGDIILPAHPHAARYRIIAEQNQQYDLHITTTLSTDGGTYMCVDANAPLAQKYRHSAQIIIIDGNQNCITTIPSNGLTVENTYYTSECVIRYSGNIVPNMVWSGPEPFTQGQASSPGQVWSGKYLTTTKSMNGGTWESLTNFTNRFLPVPVDSAENVPTFVERYNTPTITVQWSPQNMHAAPLTPDNNYEPNHVIECFADANPEATFLWHNTRTGDRYEAKTFTVLAAWIGTTQLMRCTASNTINDAPSAQDIAILVTVTAPTMSTTPTTPTTVITTTAPAVSQCGDISGYWVSDSPSLAHMCLDIDFVTGGNAHGVLRTGYEVFWYDLIGQTNVNDFDHASFTAIWPLNRAVTTLIGECHRCHGEEILILSAVSRSKGTQACGLPGEITYTEQYEFKRNPAIECPPITIPT